MDELRGKRKAVTCDLYNEIGRKTKNDECERRRDSW